MTKIKKMKITRILYCVISVQFIILIYFTSKISNGIIHNINFYLAITTILISSISIIISFFTIKKHKKGINKDAF